MFNKNVTIATLVIYSWSLLQFTIVFTAFADEDDDEDEDEQIEFPQKKVSRAELRL